MDREEFVAWLRLMGFVPGFGPAAHTVWLKTGEDKSIKIHIYTRYTIVSVMKKGRKAYNKGTRHQSFESARNRITHNLL